MDKKTCKNCKWCGKIFNGYPMMSINKAHCYRFPPIRFSDISNCIYAKNYVETDKDYCGEYKPKKK